MKQRWHGILILLLLWSIIALVKAFYLAGPGRNSRIEQAFKMASGHGRIPAMRGTVFDREKTPIIWDELRFELTAKRQLTPAEIRCISQTLGYNVPGPANGSNLLLSDLSPEDIKVLQDLIRQGFPIRINCKRERIFAVSANCRKQLKKIEADHESELVGTDGSYIVLLDRFRNWIPGSFKLIAKPVPGKDVIIEKSISELENNQ